MNMSKTTHLDVGCGSMPRNPYQSDDLYGVDIIEQQAKDFQYKQCNVVLEPLPFENSNFDSISAYDFLEHIPRFAIIDGKTVFPFIEFMNEVHRCLKDEGLFYAITPCYPRSECFVDPTHINVITNKTHKYFTIPKLRAEMYGFKGRFKVKKVKRVRFSSEVKKETGIIAMIKKLYYMLHYSKKGHVLWEFRAIK
jgi:SAM-dependent methyltransferase